MSTKSELDWRGNRIRVETTEEGRLYGGQYVSVTTVLSKLYGAALYPPEAQPYLEYAKQRGTELHRTVALLCGSNPGYTADVESIDPEVRPRVELVQGWMAAKGWIPAYVEQAWVHEQYSFAGTPDQVGSLEEDRSAVGSFYKEDRHHTRLRTESRLTVLDLKPLRAPLAALQLAAYAMAIRYCMDLQYVPRRISLQVGADTIRAVEHKEPARDRDIFLSALNCYRYGQEQKIWQ